VVVRQAYRFALDPTAVQERALRSHAGAARFAYNWGLAKCRERYRAQRKWYSAAELHKLWNAEKKADPALAWWPVNSKCTYQEAFRNLDRALRDFTDSGKGKRKGKRLGFPKRKKKGKCRDSFRFGTGVMRCSGTARSQPQRASAAPSLHRRGDPLPQGKEAPPQTGGLERGGDSVPYETTVLEPEAPDAAPVRGGVDVAAWAGRQVIDRHVRQAGAEVAPRGVGAIELAGGVHPGVGRQR
jgi:transposase